MHNQRKEDTWQLNGFFTPSIKVIPFSKYSGFHLGVVLVHANWANLISKVNALLEGEANFVLFPASEKSAWVLKSLPFDSWENRDVAGDIK